MDMKEDQEKQDKRKIVSKSDVILLVVIVLLALVALVFFRLNARSGAVVQISVDGTVVGEFSLNQNISYQADTELGKNLVVIENGQALVYEADCPDGVCVNHYPIKNVGEVIICLPHKLVVEVIE